jgi:glyoxylase-like metal-dependent hydrolase (beta-lactamase superfamily II)
MPELVIRRIPVLRDTRLASIFNTHYHSDPTGGNLAIKEATGRIIVDPRGSLSS